MSGSDLSFETRAFGKGKAFVEDSDKHMLFFRKHFALLLSGTKPANLANQ